MSTIEALLNEMEAESVTTRKMLSRVPTEKFDFKPHPKSMSLGRLATHIAELPGWVAMGLTTEEMNFARSEWKPMVMPDNQALMEFFEQKLQEGKTALANAREEDLAQTWTLRDGDTIITVQTKAQVVRMAFSQIVHHRAQIGVFVRLLNIPIPGSYGPSADED